MKKSTIFILLFTLNISFAQSTKSEITDDKKIFGLSKLWSDVKYNFVNFDLVDIDWDKTYQEYIPKVLATKSTYDYYQELIKVMASLKDGHSNVYYTSPDYGRPPLRTKLIENKVLVTNVYNDTLVSKNIAIGDEILEINNLNAIEYGKKFVMPYQSASTVQDLDNRTFHYAFFYGKINEPIVLKIKKKDNSVFTTTISRKLKSNDKKQSFELKITKDNIAHLIINDFENKNYRKIFDSLYVNILKSKALIIDVRNNGGGNGSHGYYILSHLIDEKIPTSKTKTRQYIPLYKASGYSDIFLEMSPYFLEPVQNKERYLKPVIVLTSVKTFSAAEDFLVAYDNSKRGIKIGQRTGGSTGQPISFDLPEGGKMRICTKRDMYPDGKEFVGIGIIPDIEINETIESIQKGKDIVLEKAIEVINKKPLKS
ncbi:putative S41 family peptidase [Flavobacterium psychrophilum]|uniref:S41 family peptidase n=1 Tax=Flavobacterium psychrophilum TaxID=96345 RepID=UPI00073E3868|nr:S41 family peptidase [Flavobacterium psychrophilum]SNB09920.1 putative S41 family peptidase [Flavobacterium psychrophilum]SNB26061.1 putative S41 family peptidase [Flavobacterium psychrophilum]SNB42563.1 putative S41 family peptidase [Flavobacterium psychrophilum]SNB96505.1 putative S41 family peptidase [Flavobacterium psychrophilum]GAQ49655.1 peptidase S41 [Flavobacterium psychrophilum]